jgi:heavy metal sensor kinase
MPSSSIRTRLTLWYSGLLALTFVILGIAAYLLVGYTLEKETDSALRGVAEALAERSLTEAHRRLPADVDEIFRRFFGAVPMAPYFEWLNPGADADREAPERELSALSPRARVNAAKGIATFETVTDGGQHPVRVLTWPVIDSGRLIGVVRVGMSRMNIARTLSHFLLIMAALFPIALALAAAGGWFVADRALRPVARMTQTARSIKAGQLHDRVQKTGAGDELDRLADTLNEMLGRLQTAFTEMRQFTADASHELQTPLTILRGEIEVALRSTRSPDEYKELLRSALEEIQRISVLVEGLLLLARSDAGMLKMDRVPVDLVSVAEEVFGRLGSFAAERQVDLRLGQIEPLEVLGDHVHLGRLLFNLVDNAIKYTPPHGKVEVAIGQSGGSAVIAVTDTGIGIPAEEREKVFQRFYRSAEARSQAQGGSGLGLSIARSIAEAHGGRIEVEAEPGRGSAFRAYLPILSPDTHLTHSG